MDAGDNPLAAQQPKPTKKEGLSKDSLWLKVLSEASKGEK